MSGSDLSCHRSTEVYTALIHLPAPLGFRFISYFSTPVTWLQSHRLPLPVPSKLDTLSSQYICTCHFLCQELSLYICLFFSLTSFRIFCLNVSVRPSQTSLLSLYFGGGLVAKLHLTLATSWTVACQAPLSMGFSRQEHWSGLRFPSPRDLTDSGIEPGSPALQADSLPTEL